mgnify:CR=1 FL=1
MKGVEQMMKSFSLNLRFMVFAAFAVLLSGCLPDRDQLSAVSDENFKKAQKEQYSRTLINAAVLSQSLLTERFQTAVQTGNPLDLTGFEGEVAAALQGTGSGVVQTTFCAGSGHHLTWFNSQDGSGNAVLKGLGSTRKTGLTQTLRRQISAEMLGVYDADTGSVVLSNNDGSVSMAGCPGMPPGSMPDGAPVIVFSDISMPNEIEAVQSYAYYAEACPESDLFTGERVMRRERLYPDGGPIAGTEELYANNCQPVRLKYDGIDDATRNAYEELNASGLDFSTVAGMDLGEFGSMECRNVDLKKHDLSDLPDLSELTPDRVPADLPDLSDRARQAVLAQTCIDSGSNDNLAGTEFEADGENEQYLTLGCAGTVPEFTDGRVGVCSIPPKNGTITHGEWAGTFTLRRDIEHHDEGVNTGGIGGGDLAQNQDVYQNWIGQSINCSRDETLRAQCPEFERFDLLISSPEYVNTSGAGDHDGLVRNGGGPFEWKRNNRLTRFQPESLEIDDPVFMEDDALTSTDPMHGWDYQNAGGADDCSWTEHRSFGYEISGESPENDCPTDYVTEPVRVDVGGQVTDLPELSGQRGYQTRGIARPRPDGGFNLAAWGTEEDLICHQWRVRQVGCPSGFNGIYWQRKGKTYTQTTPSQATGSYTETGWADHMPSKNKDCWKWVDISPRGKSCTGIGYDGGTRYFPRQQQENFDGTKRPGTIRDKPGGSWDNDNCYNVVTGTRTKSCSGTYDRGGPYVETFRYRDYVGQPNGPKTVTDSTHDDECYRVEADCAGWYGQPRGDYPSGGPTNKNIIGNYSRAQCINLVEDWLSNNVGGGNNYIIVNHGNSSNCDIIQGERATVPRPPSDCDQCREADCTTKRIDP